MAAGRLRLLATLALCTATFALLAVLPTVPAKASTPSVTALSPVQVNSLLGEVPLSTLDTGQLSDVLSQLPDLSGLQGLPLQEALDKVIETLLGEGATLEQLLGSETTATLSSTLKEVVGQLGPTLESLLGGNPLGKLTETLQSGNPSEVVNGLLSGSSDPQALIEKILSALNPGTLQNLLGSVLSGAPFSKTTVEGIASQLGTTPQTLAEDVGTTAAALPATAMALTAPLKNGETLAVIDGVTGGTGASGGNGSSGGPGTTTVVVLPPSASAASPTSAAAGTKAGKVKVISHKVKGDRATVVVEVPSAGKLSVGGKGLRTISRETAKAERVTLHPGLTRVGISSLRKHHRKLKVPIKVSFKQTGGTSSSASIPLVFR
ncbi:MAG TPA: hypothetical protein VH061_03795 [Solirubrobacteraceae bacterium]|nr:hypothetical protein [Solirubrobacteraceae bacterium]